MVSSIKLSTLTSGLPQINKSITISTTSKRGPVLDTFPDIMDRAIDNYLDKGGKNLISKFSFSKFLNKSLAQIMTPENFLNNGRESKVYKISDKYVARIKRGKYENNAIHSYNYTRILDKRFRGLSIYYGEPLLKVGNVEILKNATPTNYIPCGIVWRGDFAPKEDIHKYYTEFIPTCSELPQASYDEFAKCLKELNKIRHKNYNIMDIIRPQNSTDSVSTFGKEVSYSLDTINPNNVLVSDNSFKLVDSFNKSLVKNPNSVYTMIEPLLTRMTPSNLSEFHADSVIPRRNIFRKILIAAEKAELPLDAPAKDEITDYILNKICSDNKKGIQSPLNLFLTLENMRSQSVPLKERIASINKELL